MGMPKFAELVAAKSGGKIKVNVFPGGTLGGDAATVSALQGGTVEMAGAELGILASQVKDFEVYDFPFMFASAKEADAVVDGPFGQKLHAKLETRAWSAWPTGNWAFATSPTASAHQQGGRHRRPEAARDPQRHQRRLGQGAGRQPHADGLPRGLRRRWSRRPSTGRRTRCR
jgi:hypothetical protein